MKGCKPNPCLCAAKFRVCDVMGGAVERHDQGLKVMVINETKLLGTNISPPKALLKMINYINKRQQYMIYIYNMYIYIIIYYIYIYPGVFSATRPYSILR